MKNMNECPGFEGVTCGFCDGSFKKQLGCGVMTVYRAQMAKERADQPETVAESLSKTEKIYRMARKIAQTVISKQAAYGDSFGKSGDVMRLLYPDGIGPEQMDDALAVVRIVDKLFRIATSKDAFGESPFADICGYGLLGAAKNE